MKKVLILTSVEGHVSIAKAIEQSLSSSFQTKILIHKISEFNLYIPIYQLFPSLFHVPYKLSQRDDACEFARRMIDRKYRKKLFALISSQQPDIIISTYFVYDQICAEYGKVHHIPTYNVIANPRTIHPLEASASTENNLVFDEQASRTVQEYGVSISHIKETGWFVREQFAPATDKQKTRAALGLIAHIPTFLCTAGSDGTSTILKILPLFLQIHTPVQMVFICGNNTPLYKSLKLFVRTFEFAQRNSSVRFVILRYVENMHSYMQASDLVIGKAGPNSLFESVACHVPFFALTHITGQEDGNLDIIRENNLGMIEEHPLRAMEKLKKLMENPEKIEAFTESVKKMAIYNARSGQILKELLAKALI